MKLKPFLTLNAILFIPFGVGMLVIPEFIFPLLDVDLDADGLVMASTVGSMLLAFGLIALYGKNDDKDTVGMRALLIGNLSFHSIDSFLTGKAAITGVMNTMGFMFSTMHFLLAIGFLLFLIKSNK